MSLISLGLFVRKLSGIYKNVTFKH